MSGLAGGVAPALALGAADCARLTTGVATGGGAFGSSAGFFLLAERPGCKAGAIESASPFTVSSSEMGQTGRIDAACLTAHNPITAVGIALFAVVPVPS
jgi:hypothetical protein